MPIVRLDDLRIALMATSSFPEPRDAWVEASTGRVFIEGDEIDNEPSPPDLDDPDAWIPIPDRRDLDLGRALAMRFTELHLPNDVAHVAQIFRRSGAWQRFKRLLAERDRIDAWLRFDDAETDRALAEWARDEGLDVEE
jgi:hypothetical protein